VFWTYLLPMLRTSGVLPLYGRFVGLRSTRFANQQFSFSRFTRLQTPIPVFPIRPAVAYCSLHTAMQKPLDFYAGPLVWIDCEMTGLDPRKDKILEIAVSHVRDVSRQLMDD